jgi:hypothetical protein
VAKGRPMSGPGLKLKSSKFGHCSIPSALLKRANRAHLRYVARASKFGSKKTRLGATVCFSRLELTLHGSLVLSLAADVVVLPLHTRH